MPGRAVFLDRDGVLNRAFVRDGRPYPPDRIEEFEILPGVPAALDKLKRAGFLLIVVTNQPDVATGRQRREIIDAFHDILRSRLPIDQVRSCFEVDSATCRCYKPKPGLLLDAADEFGIDLSRSYMVGDRWRDIGAGKAAGCYTLFIDRHYDEPLREAPDLVVNDLAEAADHILSREKIRDGA